MATTQTSDDIQPGTYRIISGIAGTAMQVLDQDPSEVVTWQLHEGDNQHWVVQRSGDGYTFKNGRHGLYLATRSSENHSQIYASRYPITWVLPRINEGYWIQFPNTTQLFNLHCGWTTNGNKIHLFCVDYNGHNNYSTWRFEYLSDETGEMQGTVVQEENVRQRQDLNTLVELLADKERQLSEQRTLASQLEGSVRQLQEIIKAKDETLAYAYKSNEETNRLREQQNQLQNEVASLQAKMDRFEDSMSQTINNDSRSRNNAT